MTPIQERILDIYRKSVRSLVPPAQQADLLSKKAAAMRIPSQDVESYLKKHGLA